MVCRHSRPPQDFAISPEDLEVAFEEGIGFDGSAIEGFATPEEADMLAFPDASTFQILPWRPSHNGVARVFCDVCTPDRKPFAGDPRDALRRMFRKAEKAGYLLNVGAELEYYYFPDEHTPEPLDNVGYFDLSVSDAAATCAATRSSRSRRCPCPWSTPSTPPVAHSTA